MTYNKKYINRFWEKVEKTPDCWLWTAHINEKGYGYFYDGSRMKRVHRFSYEVVVGKIPKDTEIDHTCRVRNCVNPDHLEPVAHQENCIRGVGSKSHCKQGHEFTKENTIRYGLVKQRGCRVCRNNASRKYRLRLKAGL